MTLRLNGSTSGYTEIDAPAVAGSNTLVLPTGNGSADQALVTNGSGTLSFADRGRMVLETAKATTSGTSVDFTGIPSWVKRITVLLNGVSTNGTSNTLLRLGTSGGIQTSTYTGRTIGGQTTMNNALDWTNGVELRHVNSELDPVTVNGSLTFTLLNSSSNVWSVTGSVARFVATAESSFMGGVITLSGVVTTLRITTNGGTNTFDAGSINILYEG